jgi:hypothetical protein
LLNDGLHWREYNCFGRFEEFEGKESYSTNRSEFLSTFRNMNEETRTEILLNLCIKDFPAPLKKRCLSSPSITDFTCDGTKLTLLEEKTAAAWNLD